MNMKLLVGFIVVLLILLALPILATLSGGGGAPTGPAPAVGSAPPLLNTANLTNTQWEIRVKGIPIQFQLNAGGQAIAHTDSFIVKQLAGTDTLAGNWRVEGAKLHVGTMFKGKEEKTACDIIGDKIYHEGQEIKRLR